MATRSFFPHTRLMPTQKIKIEPIIDKFDSAVCVITGLISRASNVMEPWKIPTGIAEKIHPFPMAHVITIIMIKSRTALVASIEKSPVMPSSIAPIETMFYARKFYAMNSELESLSCQCYVAVFCSIFCTYRL